MIPMKVQVHLDVKVHTMMMILMPAYNAVFVKVIVMMVIQ